MPAQPEKGGPGLKNIYPEYSYATRGSPQKAGRPRLCAKHMRPHHDTGMRPIHDTGKRRVTAKCRPPGCQPAHRHAPHEGPPHEKGGVPTGCMKRISRASRFAGPARKSWCFGLQPGHDAQKEFRCWRNWPTGKPFDIAPPIERKRGSRVRITTPAGRDTTHPPTRTPEWRTSGGSH